MKWLFACIALASCLSGHTQAQLPDFTIGTKWIYETVEGPTLPLITSYKSYIITDTIHYQGENVFVIGNDQSNEIEYMHVDSSKIYFWDEVSQLFQRNYDFELNTSFATYWEGACHSDSGTAIVNLDSSSQLLIEGYTLEIQHLSVENSGSVEDDMLVDVIKYIGPLFGGLRLLLGYGFCDFPMSTTKLRCFENDTVIFNFVGYACDSTWLSLSTDNLQDDQEIIYPNPSTGDVKVKGLDRNTPYEIYTIQGNIISRGLSKDETISINQTGIFLLKLLVNEKWIIRKIVVIE